MAFLLPCRGDDAAPDDDQAKYRALATFAAVLEMVHGRYIDSDKVSYERLIQAAIKGMMQDLDTYTGYESREQHEESVRVLGGETVGVGIVVNKRRGEPLEVITPLEGSPAEAAGIKAGAHILKINDTETRNITLQDCLKLIQGKPDTAVELTIQNRGDEKPSSVTLSRKNIAYGSIPPHGVKMVEGDIGYIRIMVFNSNTAKDFDRALRKLKRTDGGLKSLVVDMRNNPGGLLNAAVDLCSRFLKPDSVVLYTSSREAGSEEAIKSYEVKNGVDPEVKVVVLINEFSASAAEIFTGALMDNKRAVSIGARSFGKATVQNIQELPDGSAIRLTIGKYLTPSKKPIQGIGITPDITVTVPPAEKVALYSQLAIYPGVVKPDMPDALTDEALAKAVEELKKPATPETP